MLLLQCHTREYTRKGVQGFGQRLQEQRMKMQVRLGSIMQSWPVNMFHGSRQVLLMSSGLS